MFSQRQIGLILWLGDPNIFVDGFLHFD